MHSTMARSAFVAASPTLSLAPSHRRTSSSALLRATSFTAAPSRRAQHAQQHSSSSSSSSSSSRSGTPRMQLRPGGNFPAPPVQERLLSIAPYLIPLLDSLSFGRYVFAKVPLLSKLLLQPLVPLYQIYRGVPFLAFGVFLALYTLVVRNTSISRYVRFNVYQALILDIALILPQLFQGVRLGFPAAIAEVCSTAVFYAAALAVAYAVVCNVQGRAPDDIPGISDSVNQQLGPF